MNLPSRLCSHANRPTTKPWQEPALKLDRHAHRVVNNRRAHKDGILAQPSRLDKLSKAGRVHKHNVIVTLYDDSLWVGVLFRRIIFVIFAIRRLVSNAKQLKGGTRGL